MFNLDTLRNHERAINAIFRADKNEIKAKEDQVVTFLTEAYLNEDRMHPK